MIEANALSVDALSKVANVIQGWQKENGPTSGDGWPDYLHQGCSEAREP